MNNVICERELDAIIDGEEILLNVQIGLPFPDPKDGGDWACTFVISGLSKRIENTMFGIDSVQAIINCIKGVDANLAYLKRGGTKISWLGMESLGFTTDDLVL